jgi:C-terminal processing protease CtpA/Prc
VGGAARGLVTRASELRLGDVAIGSPVAEISLQQKGALVSPYVAGNVGAGVLKRFNITFDYNHQRMIFETNSATFAPDVFDQSGMWINRAGAALKVYDITTGGPAESAGLKVEDRIMAVDGAPISEGSLVALRRRFRTEPPGARIRLKVESDQGKREVTLVLKELL